MRNKKQVPSDEHLSSDCHVPIRFLFVSNKSIELFVILAQGKGIGISAWGLVFLILSVILIGVSAYYFMIFYPILCKKERKYDRIELTTV